MSGARPEPTIAFLSERSDFFGGGQRSLSELLPALRDRGIRPLAILPGAGPVSEALASQRLEWADLAVPPLSAGAGLEACRALARLVRLMRRRGVGLLHSDSPRTALYSGLAARLTHRPHVWHLRASLASSALADRLLVSLSDRIIAVSRAAAGRSAATLGCARTRIVPTGLPPIDFLTRTEARARLALPEDAFVCGVIGRVERDKGRDDALGALPEVRRASPSALLVFLGPCDPQDRWADTCFLRAAAAGLSGAVRLAGEHREAARLLKAFDVVLHPSRHEALPRVLIEALFASVPVVAAGVGGVPEIIESGTSGLLVAPCDPLALGRAAASLARDPEKARRLARAGLLRAHELFGLERMARGILSVYDELLPPARQAPVPVPGRGSPHGGAHEAAP